MPKTKKSRFVFPDLTINEYVVLLFVLSAFLSVFFITALIFLLPFYIVFSGQFKKALPKSKTDYFLLLFGFSALFSSAFFSKEGLVGKFVMQTDYMILLAIGVIILIFDIYFFVEIMTKRSFDLGLKFSAILSVFCFLIAAFQRIFEIYPDPVRRPGRVASLFINENYYANVTEFVFLIAVYLFFQSKKTSKKGFYIFIALLNVASLFLCQTRTSFFVVAITLFVFLFFSNRKISYYVIGAIAVLLLLLFAFPDMLPRFDSFFSFLEYRVGIWKTALQSFLEFPWFGKGYFAYTSIWRDYLIDIYYPALHAHNIFIDLLINFGLVGSFFLAVFSFLKFKACLREGIQSGDSSNLAFVVSCAVAIFIHGLSDSTLFWPQTGFFLIFIFTCPRVYRNEVLS